MAETSLRAYVREIDDLIEHNQLDEAIAHARGILQTYPRHLETYRLLGKAYLEAKRFGDSADILQRVLSAVPDDFVAHVGMSIVREDEGNLDSAIWHMERAFETSPSNAAVQGELRRLIGKRDGLEPPKVRLTRGALARMYAHGELYPQAIAELRAALSEEPDRPDLQVLLADMYWRTNQRKEAAEVAAAILETLPNCREANRILAAALHAEGRTEEALTYHRRVAALDPYTALVETILDDPARVDANSVRIEKLTWQPGQPLGRDTGPAEWASGVAAQGREAAAARPAPRPSWLDSIGAATSARQAASQPEAEAPSPAPAEPTIEAPQAPKEGQPPVPSEIPDWMEEAGWSPGSGEAKEGPISFSDDELRSLEGGQLPPEAAAAPTGELARAQIPDWLQDVAPAVPDETEPEEAAAPPTDAGFQPSGLAEPRLPPGWTPSEAGSDADDDWLKAAAEDAPALPTWMEEESPGATATIVTWLGDRSRSEESAEKAEAPGAHEEPEPEPEPSEAPELARTELPEWLSEDSPAAAGEEEAGRPAAVPGWLSGVAEAAAKGSSIEPDEVEWEPEDQGPIVTGMYPEPASEIEESPAPADLPDWLQTIAGSGSVTRSRDQIEAREPAPVEPPPATQPQEAGIGDSGSFDWLRELAETEPPTPAAAADTGSDDGEAPSWLSATRADESSRSALGRSAGPEWLRGIAEPEEAAPADSQPASTDWLRGIAEVPAEDTTTPPEPAVPEPPAGPDVGDVPSPEEAAEWVNMLASAEPSASEAGSTGEWLRLLKSEGIPPAETPAPTTAAPPAEAGDMDDDQVFDWLESLAAKQGIPAPEQVQPTTVSAGREQPEPPPPSRPLPEEPEAGLEWLEELAAEQTAPEPEEQVPPTVPSSPAVQAPEPVAEMAAEPVPVPVPAPPGPVAAAPPPPPTVTPTAPPAGPVVPDWLKQLVSETPSEEEREAAAVEEAAEEVSPTTETWPSLPSWMLSESPGEDEPTVPPLPPVERIQAPAVAVPEPEPIDELAEGWVPPWEAIQIDESGPDASTAPEAPEAVEAPPPAAVRPETPAPVAMAMEPPAQAEAEPEAMPTAAEPEPVQAPPRYQEPKTDVLEEIPEWLRTQTPRSRQVLEEAVPEPAMAAESEEPDVPDWLVAPETPPSTAAVPEPVAAVPVPEPVAPIPEPEPVAATAVPEPEPPPTPAIPEPAPAAEPARGVLAEPVEAPREIATVPSPAEPQPAAAVPPPLPSPAPKAPASARRAPETGRAKPDLDDRLREARQALATGEYRRAASDYGAAVKRKYRLVEVIRELEIALDRNPKAAPLWQVLGDAYMKADRLPEAISAYQRGVAAV